MAKNKKKPAKKISIARTLSNAMDALDSIEYALEEGNITSISAASRIEQIVFKLSDLHMQETGAKSKEILR